MINEQKKELYRDSANGKIAGVCAGLADYFGWETWLIRVLVVSATLFGMQFLILLYIAGWFILDKKPKSVTQHSKKAFNATSANPNADNEADLVNESIKVKSKVWQAGEPPQQAFYDIKRKFTLLEGQLRSIERYVTSPEYTVSREINKL